MTDDDKIHSATGFSSLPRIARCPGSLALSVEAERQGMVPPAGEAAEEGTLLHSLVGDKPPYGGQILTNEQRHLLDRAWSYIARRTTDPPCGPERLLATEYEHLVSVRYPPFTGKIVSIGRPDVTLIYTNHARIIEFKFGRGSVSGIFEQLRAEAVGVMQTFHAPRVLAYGYQVREEVEFIAEFSDASLEANAIETKIRYAKDNPDDYSPSDEACRYCPGRGICPALGRDVATLPNAALLASPEKLAAAMRLVPAVEAWAKAVKDLVRSSIEGGLEIPGYELREEKFRQLIDQIALVPTLKDSIPIEDLLRCAKWTLADLEGLLRRHDMSPAEVKNFMARITTDGARKKLMRTVE